MCGLHLRPVHITKDSLAKKFASEGYKVAMLARRKENLDALEKEIKDSKGYVCDVSVTAQVHATIALIS